MEVLVGASALLDANVLYPAPLRDLLLSLADEELFDPRWSSEIQQEWIDAVLEEREDLKRSQLNRTEKVMNMAFPDANITGYEYLIANLSLPDPDDRHVLAATIHCQADYLVTFNRKDFPADELKKYNILLASPDNFILGLLHSEETLVIQAFRSQLARLKKPPQTSEQLLNTLEKCGLPNAVAAIRKALSGNS